MTRLDARGLEALSRTLDRTGDPDHPSAEELGEILTSVRRVAVVGMSRDPAKAARRVPSYLAAKGYEIVPVNPNAERILGKEARARLEDVEEPVDMVLVFRPSDEAGEFVRAAAERPEGPVIWLQEGIRDDEAAAAARERGRTVIQDLCVFKVHRALDPG